MPETEAIRLTSLSSGGGCGCKISPAVLRDILQDMPEARHYAPLLVGRETSDDAAVWQLNDHQALVATTDFFMPIVDDAADFGRIAAANALSDIYAMGGTPILALAIVGMPLDKLPVAVIRRILASGAAICEQAGVPVAGGHSIDSQEPIYGLAVIGLVDPARLRRNAGALPGDRLLLTKPLGVGVLSAALKRGLLDDSGYAALLDSTTRLNAIGPELAAMDAVHAMTDVTGFGLFGHALEMARASNAAIEILPAGCVALAGAERLLRDGVRTGASARNWQSVAAEVDLPVDFPDWQRDLLTDPQTSGGLLLAVAEDAADQLLHHVRQAGFADAACVGRVVVGAPRLRVAASV